MAWIRRTTNAFVSHSCGAAQRTLCACIAFLMLMSFAMEFAQSQDIDAIQHRLADAVKEGELEFRHAAVMMDALRDFAEEEEWEEERHHRRGRGGHDRTEHREDEDESLVDDREREFHQFTIRIMNAVESGDISEEDAERKINAMKARLLSQQNGDRDDVREEQTERYQIAKRRIIELAEEGKITEEQAEGRLHAMRAHLQQRVKQANELSQQSKLLLAAIERRLEAAVESGEMNEEQAEAILGGYEVRLRQGSSEPLNRDRNRDEESNKKRYEQAESELGHLVEQERITPAQAKARLRGLREKIWSTNESNHETSSNDDSEKEQLIELVRRRLKIAVENGELNQDEARVAFQKRKALIESSKDND